MQLEVLPDAEAVARRAARRLAASAASAVEARGRFLLAVSGGRTALPTLRAFAEATLPWDRVHVFQVDERVAPAGHPDRNLEPLRDALLGSSALPPENLHPMPVEAPDLEPAAAAYASELERVAGAPPVLDVVQLGLGTDGHTASLVPEDPVLDERERHVAVTGPYAGRRRMTLTYPVLDVARQVLWIVTGEEKAAALSRLLEGDASIPAGRVPAAHATVLADRDAAGRA